MQDPQPDEVDHLCKGRSGSVQYLDLAGLGLALEILEVVRCASQTTKALNQDELVLAGISAL